MPRASNCCIFRPIREVSRLWLPFFLVLLVLAVQPSTALAQHGNAVSASRYARLAKGMNLSRWFAYGSFERYSDAELQWMHDQGITAVRLAFNPKIATWTPLQQTAFVAQLGDAIDQLISYRIAVVLDPHNNNSTYGVSLKSEADIASFVQLWSMLASQYSNRDPEYLFFEVMNEPDNSLTVESWTTTQARVITAIRQAASNHTIVVTPNNWSGIDSVVAMPLVDDRNVVYTFHYYEPGTFTHQGAYWSSLGALSGLEYPSSLPSVQSLFASTTDSTIKSAIQQYIDQQWDDQAIRKRIDVVADWARSNDIRVWLGEFGAILWASPVYGSRIKIPIPVESRARWLRAVRVAAEQNGIGWCMWDFKNDFGLINTIGGGYTVIPEVVTALGLGPVMDVALTHGWNLIGNPTDVQLIVATVLGDTSKVASAWKWNPDGHKWAFYSPALTSEALSNYAASSGYDVLNNINGGEGFWVNAKAAFTVQLPLGTPVISNSFQNLTSGWHLISTNDITTPSVLNDALNVTAPAVGVVPQNFSTLWAWDSAASKWYFYAPSLDTQGGTVLSDYITTHGYLDFASVNKTLGPGVGFWVNKP